jgi:hypothetical protein
LVDCDDDGLDDVENGPIWGYQTNTWFSYNT